MILSPEEAYARLADRCAVAEMCAAEARDKLRTWGIASADAEKIVARLVRERFIDDARFARIWLRDKLRNARWGLLKIKAAARLKHLDISQAIEEEWNDEIYFANLAAAIRGKAKNMPSPLGRDDRQKVMRFAVSRGYEPGLVMEMIVDEEYWRNEPAD